MFIELNKLNYFDEIKIDDNIEIPKNYYEKTDIVSLSKIVTIGNIIYKNDKYEINLNLSGTMMLHDSMTYDIIPYNFEIKIEESLEKSSKTLDLISFLWHYIILEVPLRFTVNDKYSIKTDNYQLISEEEYSRKKNPFSDFKME